MNVHLPRFPGHLTLHPPRHHRNPHRRNYTYEQRKQLKPKTVVTNASDTFLISKRHSTGLKVSHASFIVSPRFYHGNVPINVAQNTKKIIDLFRDLLILIVGHVLVWSLFLWILRYDASSWESYVNINLHERSGLDFRLTKVVRKRRFFFFGISDLTLQWSINAPRRTDNCIEISKSWRTGETVSRRWKNIAFKHSFLHIYNFPFLFCSSCT